MTTPTVLSLFRSHAAPIDQLTAADAETAVEETFVPSASAAPSSRVGLRSSLASGCVGEV